MKRINIHFSERQIEQLKALSEEAGLSVAEIVRRAIDAFIAKEKLK